MDLEGIVAKYSWGPYVMATILYSVTYMPAGAADS